MPRRFYFLLTLTVLVGAFLRLWQLTAIPPGLHYDLAATALLGNDIAFNGYRPIFIPAYWIPQFKAIPLGKELYLESLLFCGVLGGFCACSWQVAARRGLFLLRPIHPALTLIAPVLFLAVYLPGGTEVPVNFVYFAGGAMALGTGVLIGFLGREAAPPILLTGLAATLIYGVIYYVFWVTFPSLRASSRSLDVGALSMISSRAASLTTMISKIATRPR